MYMDKEGRRIWKNEFIDMRRLYVIGFMFLLFLFLKIRLTLEFFWCIELRC